MATRAEPRDHRPRRAAAALVFVVVVFVIAPIFAMLATAY
jgi:predicted PurR-regulated permease PerM